MTWLRRPALLAGLAGAALALTACGSDGLTLHAGSGSASVVPTVTPSVSPVAEPTTTTTPSASATTPSEEPVTPSVDVTATRPVDGLPPVLHRIDTQDPVVFITIDDGYTKDPAVIALLKARGAVVTPFLAQTAITTDPGYFRDLQKATGQVPQDHTITHPNLTHLGLAAQVAQICGAADQYQTWFGTRPWLFRPPYGAYDQTTRRAAKACGMTTLVLWDVSLPHSVLRFASGSTFRRGDILLIHWRPNLARDLGIALDTIAAQGLRVASLQDYLPRPS